MYLIVTLYTVFLHIAYTRGKTLVILIKLYCATYYLLTSLSTDVSESLYSILCKVDAQYANSLCMLYGVILTIWRALFTFFVALLTFYQKDVKIICS